MEFDGRNGKAHEGNRVVTVKVEMEKVHEREEMPHVEGARCRVYARIGGDFIGAEESIETSGKAGEREVRWHNSLK